MMFKKKKLLIASVCQGVADIEHPLNVKDCILKTRGKNLINPNLAVSTHSFRTWFNVDEKSHILKLEQIDLICFTAAP